GIVDDIRCAHPCGQLGPSGIHTAPDPQRLLFIDEDDDRLMDIETPCIIAGEVTDIGGVGEYQHFHAVFQHLLFCPVHPCFVFLSGEHHISPFPVCLNEECL